MTQGEVDQIRSKYDEYYASKVYVTNACICILILNIINRGPADTFGPAISRKL